MIKITKFTFKMFAVFSLAIGVSTLTLDDAYGKKSDKSGKSAKHHSDKSHKSKRFGKSHKSKRFGKRHEVQEEPVADVYVSLCHVPGFPNPPLLLEIPTSEIADHEHYRDFVIPEAHLASYATDHDCFYTIPAD